jgi:signal transduction histidine kinase
VTSALDLYLLYRNTPPEVEARIGAAARAQTAQSTRPLALVAATVGLLWWPLDLLLYAGRPEVVRVFSLWRVAVVVYCLAFYFTSDRTAWLRRHFVLWGATLGSGISFVIGASLGSLGSLDQPWFGSLYLVPIMSFPFLMRPGVRLLSTTTVSLAALVGFFGLHPGNLANRDVGTGFGLMLFSIAVSVSAGHAMYHWFRHGFLQSERLDLRTRELEELSQTLVARVEARTTELRLLAAHMDKLAETERRALSRELHDELGQLLQGIRVELDLADKVRRRGGDPTPNHDRLGELLDATVASTRSILSNLRPRILDDFGIVAAVEWLTADVQRRSRLKLHFRSEPEEFAVSDDIATVVFRIVQESLTNVQKHARAGQVWVRLTLDAQGLVVTVDDDGAGLPPLEQRRTGSMGLLGMRERALAFGGSFEVANRSEGGARMVLRLPPITAPPALKESA